MTPLTSYTEVVIRNLQTLQQDEVVMESVAGLLAENRRGIIALGVGKSSFIARKFVASLQSLSKEAHFMHPTEALHGDVGLLAEGHVCCAISKSGNSQELNALLPIIRQRGATLIALTNVASSPLGRAADVVLPLRVGSEGDEHNLLPLASCEASLFICDYLVLRVAAKTGFTPELFKSNHPGGQIGLNLSRRLVDLPEWQDRKPFVSEGATLIEALIQISASRAGICCVVDPSGVLLGVVTDGDVRRAITQGTDLRTARVKDIMNKTPKVVMIDTPLTKILDAMECGERKIASMPVLAAGGRCAGIVQIHDLVR